MDLDLCFFVPRPRPSRGPITIADANKAIELDPANHLSYVARGHARLERKQRHEAISDFSKAIEISPRSYSAFFGRSQAYFVLRQEGKARDDIDQALACNPPENERREFVDFRKFIGDNP